MNSTRLLIVAAAIEMFQGLSIYVFPRDFWAPVYEPLRPFFPLISAALVASGVLLLLLMRFPLSGAAARGLAVLPAAPLALQAWFFGDAGVWEGTVFYGLLAAAVAASPWLPPPAGEPADGASDPDLAAATFGLIQAVTGLLMLVAPGAVADPAVDPIGSMRPVTGLLGLVGGAALIVPEPRRGWAQPRSPWRQLAGSIFPLLVIYSFARMGIWTGVVAWGAWVLGPLTGLMAWSPGPLDDGRPAAQTAASDSLASTERLLEMWTWLLALVVIVLSAVNRGEAMIQPLTAQAFVVGAALFNSTMYWGPGRRLAPERRVFWHLAFLTVALGLGLAGARRVDPGFLALLTATPILATRALGSEVGSRILGLGLTTVVVGQVRNWALNGAPLFEALGAGAVQGLVLAAAAAVGMRSAAEQRRLIQDLTRAQADLQNAYEELMAQQAEIQAQHEELQRRAEAMEAMQARILHLADHDPLTDLLNRRRFREELDRHLAEAGRYGENGALLFLDLDGFKRVNDTLGHQAGDALLVEVSRVLRAVLRETDVVARLGGDEFAALLPRAGGEQALAVARRILAALAEHTSAYAGVPGGIRLSIGVALYPEHGLSAEELLTRADAAMYQAKAGRGHAACLYGTAPVPRR
ncbi:GGDEF domain-containing protein [Caldinitratiruptor microaerophilus]|uniref:GGDEF domain-containing protein n=1 Tax=Caldinitratiruptor microaerophilus TaxID=671077 RepID=A0AA35CQM8_9FIRM|nr:GGDEF domain-containing protein [Caldinitratiruptor microaerophilus]BDG62171.1 hypothetical protein caldi_32610 [Caldinitratiruptor microaerophilus]